MRPVLVDTSAWVRYFREKDDREGDIIADLVEDGVVCTTGIVIAELISGAGNNREKAKLKEILSVFPFLNITEPVWWKVGEYRNKMRLGGFTAGLPDTIIATAAIHYDAQLFTLDSHFANIAKFMPLSLLK